MLSDVKLCPGNNAEAVLLVDGHGRIREANGAACRLYGCAEAELLALSLKDLCPSLSCDASGTYEALHWAREGRRFPASLTVVAMLLGDERVLLVTVRDMTEQRAMEAQHLQAVFQATHDALTGLPNRRAWEQRLQESMLHAADGTLGTVMLLDLDHFKAVNDTMGHLAGDRLLVELSGCIARALRRDDFLARLGGDEFGAILDDVTPSEGLAIAERIRQGVEDFRFHAAGRFFDPTISIGVAIIDGSEGCQRLQARADAALYEAKAQGRNQIVSPLDAGVCMPFALYEPAS